MEILVGQYSYFYYSVEELQASALGECVGSTIIPLLKLLGCFQFSCVDSMAYISPEYLALPFSLY